MLSEQDFFKLVKSNGLQYMLDTYSSNNLKIELNNLIEPGCHLMQFRDDPIVRKDISVRNIVGQVGVFNSCHDNCCSHQTFGGSTWVSASTKRNYDGILELLHINPEYYFKEIEKPLEFFTDDNINYYSRGCSKRAILAKLILSLYNEMYGKNILLKNVIVNEIKPIINTTQKLKRSNLFSFFKK